MANSVSNKPEMRHFQQWAKQQYENEITPLFGSRYFQSNGCHMQLLKNGINDVNKTETYHLYGGIIGELWREGEEIATWREGEGFFSLFICNGVMYDKFNPKFRWELVDGGEFLAGQEGENQVHFYFFTTMESFLKGYSTKIE